MRAVARALLLVFVFAVPWEYSLDFGAPWGNVARLTGVVLLLVAVPAVFREGRVRTPGPLHVLTLAVFLWMCATSLWSIDPATTLERLPGYFQELMIVALAREFVADERELRDVFCAWLLGSWVLAVLTAVAFAANAAAGTEIRFVAAGQDPNDVARFLAFGLPVAAFVFDADPRRWFRWVAALYIPVGTAAILLTASRGGFVASLVALTGCVVLLAQKHRRLVFGGALALPLFAVCLSLLLPAGSLARLASIAAQVQGGDLNQRVNIWDAGWHAFLNAPFFGHGAGTFVSAAGLAPIDTAHNTVLSVLVEGGIAGLSIGIALIACATAMAFNTHGVLRIALLTLLAVLCVASMVGTTGENRMTWLLFALIGLAHRLSLPAEGQDASLRQARAARVET